MNQRYQVMEQYPIVSEEKYEYGAEAFEAFMARQGNMEIYTDTIQKDMQKTGKSR